jgi:small neutral amino acid transporter SnatA (MarC family)
MNFESVSVTSAIDIFLLLLIGIGPKIALVPFLEATADMPAATKGRVVRKMLTTATSASAEAGSIGVFAVVAAELAVVIVIDAVVFRWANRVSEHLNENRMLVTERCSASCSRPWPCSSPSTDWPTWE